MTELEFTGEFHVPGKSGERVEQDHLARYEFAARFVKGARVLDIACGAGYAGPIMISAGAAEYLGVDIQPGLVEHATSHYGTENIGYAVGDVTDFQSSRLFDVIICFETIEHVAEYDAALACLYRALAPSGTMLLSSPNRLVTSPGVADLTGKPWNTFHTQEFTPPELLDAVKAAGFTVDPNEVYGQRLRFMAPRWLWPVNKMLRLIRKSPDEHASPKVGRTGRKSPRYFLLRATKSGARDPMGNQEICECQTEGIPVGESS